MNINRNNYEAFFLDFAEGRLSANEEEELNLFLASNPDLEKELRDFELLQLSAEEVRMPARETLKKVLPLPGDTVCEQNFEIFAIAFLENDLDDVQRGMFTEFMNSDETYRRQFELIRLTFLEKEEIIYPAKESLKRSLRPAFNYRLLIPFAAAAAIAVLIMIRTEPLVINNEITSLPEVLVTGSVEEKEPGINKPELKQKATTIQIIKSSRKTLPVTKVPAIDKTDEQKEDKGKTAQRIAGLNMRKTVESAALRQFALAGADQGAELPLIISPLPAINGSSLALADRLRFGAGKASEIMDEEDVFIWNIAAQGLEEINRLAGTEMSLIASHDDEGDISGFRFRSKVFSLTAPVRSDED